MKTGFGEKKNYTHGIRFVCTKQLCEQKIYDFWVYMPFNMFLMQKKPKRIAKFDGLEPRRCEDIKGIVAPEIGPKSFGTFEKQAPATDSNWRTKQERKQGKQYSWP